MYKYVATVILYWGTCPTFLVHAPKRKWSEEIFGNNNKK
jgi:hypothetical protein